MRLGAVYYHALRQVSSVTAVRQRGASEKIWNRRATALPGLCPTRGRDEDDPDNKERRGGNHEDQPAKRMMIHVEEYAAHRRHNGQDDRNEPCCFSTHLVPSFSRVSVRVYARCEHLDKETASDVWWVYFFSE